MTCSPTGEVSALSLAPVRLEALAPMLLTQWAWSLNGIEGSGQAPEHRYSSRSEGNESMEHLRTGDLTAYTLRRDPEGHPTVIRAETWP